MRAGGTVLGRGVDAFLVAAALMLGACSSGEGPADLDPKTPQAPAKVVDRIGVTLAVERTVFREGAMRFTVSPPLASIEQVRCLWNGAPAVPCMLDPENGEIHFVDAAFGRHDVHIEVGSTSMRASASFDVVEPGVVVFAATPGGIAAAIAAAREKQTVALLEPTQWVGGMISGGLVKTDVGPRGHEIVGGIADEFFRRARDIERARGACIAPCNSYDLEPHVAEQVFEAMLVEAGVILERGVGLLGVRKDGQTLLALETDRGEVAGQVFIDASYEGDLMALAGIDYRLGREARDGGNPSGASLGLAELEDHAGTPGVRLPLGTYVDPFLIPGDPTSGTIPFVEPKPARRPQAGEGDSRVMAYNYRLCVTDDPSNRVPFVAPPGYDVRLYEAHARLAEALAMRGLDLAEIMFNPARTVYSADRAHYKYDLNGGSTFSSDMTAPHLNQAYVEGTERGRERIRVAYRRYIEGMLYTWQTDPRFGPLRAKVARFGFCRDEFQDRGGWPHQLYVRIARRMVGEYVMNENDVMQNGRRPPITDPVGFGSYDLDMHAHRYLVADVNWPDGTRREAIVVEGFLIERLPNDAPYPISYRSLVPKARDATNFLNPVTLSATQVAMSSIRMEPTFMILGQAAGTAAALAIETRQPVQNVPYDALRLRLLQARQVLRN